MLFTNYDGRLANQTIQLLGYSILAEKLDLKISNMPEFEIIERFGLKIFCKGRKLKSDKIIVYRDKDLELLTRDDFVTNEPIEFKGNFQVGWFLKKYNHKLLNMFTLKEEAKFDSSSIYMMVRLGDMSFFAPPFTFYEKAIKLINKKNKYLPKRKQKLFISTDSPKHPLILYFLIKYKFKIINLDSYEKILFARKFNNLILTAGSFNWLSAILSNAENIVYPELEKSWHPDYYSYFNWSKIKLSKISKMYIELNKFIFLFLFKRLNVFRIRIKRYLNI